MLQKPRSLGAGFAKALFKAIEPEVKENEKDKENIDKGLQGNAKVVFKDGHVFEGSFEVNHCAELLFLNAGQLIFWSCVLCVVVFLKLLCATCIGTLTLIAQLALAFAYPYAFLCLFVLLFVCCITLLFPEWPNERARFV